MSTFKHVVWALAIMKCCVYIGTGSSVLPSFVYFPFWWQQWSTSRDGALAVLNLSEMAFSCAALLASTMYIVQHFKGYFKKYSNFGAMLFSCDILHCITLLNDILCAILYDNNSSTFHAQHFAQSAEMGCELPLRVELFDDFPFCSENRSCFEACFANW